MKTRIYLDVYNINGNLEKTLYFNKLETCLKKVLSFDNKAKFDSVKIETENHILFLGGRNFKKKHVNSMLNLLRIRG